MDTTYTLISIQPFMKSQDPIIQWDYYKGLIEQKLLHQDQTTDFIFITLPEYAFGNRKYYSEEKLFKLKSELASFTQQHECYLITGSYAHPQDNTWFNRSLIFDPHGTNQYYYDKTHPFNFEKKNGVSPGLNRNVFTINNLKVKLLICSDLWFPEEIRSLQDEKIDLILVPAMAVVRNQSLVNYGQTLWHSLALTRSKENVIPLVVSDWAIQPVRDSYTCGASCIIDPSVRWQNAIEEPKSFNKFTTKTEGALVSIISRNAVLEYQAYRREVGLLPE